MTNHSKEQLNILLENHEELKPLIRDILAENHISDTSYAGIFRLLYSTMVADASQEVSYHAPTKEWKIGRRTLSDVKLFTLMARVCDIVRYFVRDSWEDCILSAWDSDDEIQKLEKIMDSMESLSHVRNVLKIAATNMVYGSSDELKFEEGGEEG